MNVQPKNLDDAGTLQLLSLDGEMDAFVAASVEKEIASILECGCRGLILDMSKVSYIDSSGIRVLLSAHKKLAKIGGKLNVLSPSEQVVKILELADLIDMLKIFDTMDEALADLAAAS